MIPTLLLFLGMLRGVANGMSKPDPRKEDYRHQEGYCSVCGGRVDMYLSDAIVVEGIAPNPLNIWGYYACKRCGNTAYRQVPRQSRVPSLIGHDAIDERLERLLKGEDS